MFEGHTVTYRWHFFHFSTWPVRFEIIDFRIFVHIEFVNLVLPLSKNTSITKSMLKLNMLNTIYFWSCLISLTAEHYCPILVDNGIMEIVQWLITSPGEKVTELGKRFIDVAKDFNLMRIK